MAGNQAARARTLDMSHDRSRAEIVHPAQTPPAPSSPYSPGLRLAWWGRVSTEDQQDPTLSLPRQLHNSRTALPAGALIVAHYYDVESGRKDLALRGYSHAHERFDIPIPRDGGIQELLAESKNPNRRFDAVICESIERVARRTYYGTKIEHDLEAAGVALFAADEPIILNGKKATTILTRRVKQGVAEWYVLEILEKSWDGFCEHTRQGGNVGVPPYGYMADKVPHPVPSRRAEGRTKTRLVPDPARAPVVHQMFIWRVTERLGYGTIAERLNADPDRYPVPRSLDPARQRDAWGKSTVRAILVNPKYTGYMVWNRRAMKKGGNHNPPSTWVWSPQPTHEPLVTKSVFDAAAGIADRRHRSRDGGGLNSHPETTRSYLLRSFVICEACGRRMYGRFNKKSTYYVCQPALNHAGKVAERFPDHPASIWIREDPLLAAITEFFAKRILGPDRSDLLAADLGVIDHRTEADQSAQLDALRRSLDDIRNRQDRLIRTLEIQDEPGGAVFTRVQDRLRELEVERQAKLNSLADLEATDDVPETVAVDLLDQLPVLGADLFDAPADQLRRLFEAFRLVVRYRRADHHALIQVTLTDDTIDYLNADVIPLLAPQHRPSPPTRRTAPRHGSAEHPQRDSNPCCRLERAVS